MSSKNELGVQLCEAMNIPVDSVREITLIVGPWPHVNVTVERIPHGDEVNNIKKVIEEYQFTPRKKGGKTK